MKKDSTFKDEMAAIAAFEKQPENLVKVLSVLENPHPIVAATAKALSSEIKDNGICQTSSKLPLISLNVSARLVDRLLRNCDALFKALEQRGVTIVTQTDNGAPVNAAFRLKNVTVPFLVDEPVRSYPFEPVTKEECQVPRDRWPKYRYLPGGLLRIRTSQGSSQGMLVETRSKPLEGQLNQLICIIFRQAFTAHEDEAIRREREDRSQKFDARLERFRKYLRRKEKWKAELKEMMAAHHEAVKIRKFLEGMEQAGTSKRPEWMIWAKDYADRIDPLVKKG